MPFARMKREHGELLSCPFKKRRYGTPLSARSAFVASDVDCEAENQPFTSPSVKGAEGRMNRAWTDGIPIFHVRDRVLKGASSLTSRRFTTVPLMSMDHRRRMISRLLYRYLLGEAER